MRSGPVRCNNKIILALDLEAGLEVSLVRQHFLKPTEIAERYRGSILTNEEMVLRLRWLYARPTAAYKAGVNLSNFEVTKAHRALLRTAHGANRILKTKVDLP